MEITINHALEIGAAFWQGGSKQRAYFNGRELAKLLAITWPKLQSESWTTEHQALYDAKVFVEKNELHINVPGLDFEAETALKKRISDAICGAVEKIVSREKIVPLNHGDEIELNLVSQNGLGSKIIATTRNGTVACWEMIVREIEINPRVLTDYYSRHRYAKGETVEYETEFIRKGDTDRVLELIEDQLPEAFKNAQWFSNRENYKNSFSPLTNRNDAWDQRVNQFLQGLCVGGTGWYGNTDKKLIAAVKRAQKTLKFIAN